jgi:HK97 family phage major capsid protein
MTTPTAPGKSELAETLKELTAVTKELVQKGQTPANGNAPLSGALSVPATAAGPEAELGRGFRDPREFLMCVMKAYCNEGVDKRLEPLMTRRIEKNLRDQGIVTKAVGSDEQTGINDPYGGFLVPPAFSPDLLKIEAEADPIGKRVTSIPMSSPTVRMPARVDKNHTTSVSGGLTVTRRPETVAGTSARMEFEAVELRAHSLFGLAYATEEILTDSPISFAAILAAGFSDQFTYHLINERISGTGVGEFEGVLNSPALITVSAETGQAASTILVENVYKMRSRCWGYGKAIWLANYDTMPQLMLLNQAVGTGGAVVWQPSAREDVPDMLLGRPLVFTEYAKSIGTAGDLFLGNWAEYLEGTYQPLRNDESIHVRFVNHERAFKFWMRNDGRCWWRTALTPKNSTQTLSPFVALAGR